MRTSNLSPKKLSHRSNNRPPKLYRWADIGTEALIYFTILWGPWAFGTVHDWAILTMNLANYGIGALLLTKWAIRCTTCYYPFRWTAQRNGHSTPQPNKRDWRTKAIAALTIYMLGYILISILNVRAAFNHEFNIFEYQDNYIKWLPHTYDQHSTIQYFLVILGLSCSFWGIRDWLYAITCKERRNSIVNKDKIRERFDSKQSILPIPIRLKRLLWLLSISGGLIALIGIIQRLDGTANLLWIYERTRFAIPEQSYGPFGYRGNGATYLNLILPLTIGLLIYHKKLSNSGHPSLQTKSKSQPYYLLILCIFIFLYGSLLTLSRTGFLLSIFILILCILLYFKKHKLSKRIVFSLLVLFPILYLLGVQLISNTQFSKRWNVRTAWHETDIKAPVNQDEITANFYLPSPPYVKPLELWTISNSKISSYQNYQFLARIYPDATLQILFTNITSRANIYNTYDLSKIDIFNKTNLITVSRKENLLVKINNIQQKTITSSNSITKKWNQQIIPNEIEICYEWPINQDNELIRFYGIKYLSESDGIKAEFSVDGRNSLNIMDYFKKVTGRSRIYDDAWTMFKDFVLLGCGAGSWSQTYILYRDMDEPWHAWVHCDWLEYGITLGILGGLPCIVILGLLFIHTKQNPAIRINEWIIYGVNISLITCLIHAVVDFPLQVVSTMHLFIVIGAIRMTFKNFYGSNNDALKHN